MSSSAYIANKGKGILILGKCPAQGLDDTTLITETQYSINFSRSNILQKYINSKQKVVK